MSGAHQGRCWTDQENAILKRLWREGVSSSQIAKALVAEGFALRTRNSVIGRVFRMGLSFEGRPVNGGEQHRALKARRKPRSPDRSLSRAHVTPQPPSEPMPGFFGELWPLINDISALTDETCRWPVGDPKNDHSFGYCGRMPATGPYCACHAARAVRPLTARQRGIANTFRPEGDARRYRDSARWGSL